jgi:hypothetical protein
VVPKSRFCIPAEKTPRDYCSDADSFTARQKGVIMQSFDISKRKPYERPILRELTSEQAVVFLVGHAYIGNQGAKELMEMLFPNADGTQNRAKP